MDALKCKFRGKNQRTAIADLLTTPRKNVVVVKFLLVLSVSGELVQLRKRPERIKIQNFWRWLDAPNIRLFSSLADKKSTDG